MKDEEEREEFERIKAEARSLGYVLHGAEQSKDGKTWSVPYSPEQQWQGAAPYEVGATRVEAAGKALEAIKRREARKKERGQ